MSIVQSTNLFSSGFSLGRTTSLGASNAGAFDDATFDLDTFDCYEDDTADGIILATTSTVTSDGLGLIRSTQTTA